jgi:predicted MFS family arabinose efflux permease
LSLDEGALGLLLLCLGLGSITAMPITGVLTTRIGCKAVITSSALLIPLTLPLLAVLDGWLAMAIAIAVFGAALGTLDVAMNIQAIIVERSSGRAMMSGFHGLYSVGGIAGAGLMSLLLGSGAMSPVLSAGVISAASLVLLVIAMPGLLPYGDDGADTAPPFAWPKGIVLFVGLLCFLCFLVEGAVLDWSAVFLISERGSDVGLAGLGYAAFAIAMTLGRLLGDRLRTILGEQRVLITSGLLAAAGFLVVVLVPSVSANLLGFLLVGAGASNVVPVLFSAAGRTRAMPASLAVTAVTTLGYLGILAGPLPIWQICGWPFTSWWPSCCSLRPVSGSAGPNLALAELNPSPSAGYCTQIAISPSTALMHWANGSDQKPLPSGKCQPIGAAPI